MSYKETAVRTGVAGKLHLVTREEWPQFVICGDKTKVDEALVAMGVDPVSPGQDSIFTGIGYWVDIALPQPPEIGPTQAHQIVFSFSNN